MSKGQVHYILIILNCLLGRTVTGTEPGQCGTNTTAAFGLAICSNKIHYLYDC